MKIIIQAACCFLLLTFLAPVAQGQKMSKIFSGIKKISLSTSSGNCKLIKGKGNEVQVNVSYTYFSNDYLPIMEQDGSTLELKEDFAKKVSYSGSSSWELTIPEDIEIRYSSGSGDFEASEMAVKISANTGSGDYRWKSITGNSRINTGSGNISINDFHGEIDLNTGSGDVDITKAEGELHANTGSGKINLLNVKGKLSANVGSGDINGKDLVLTGKGSFNSGSGDVSIKLGSALDYPISVNSGSGDASLDFNGNKMEGKVIMTVNKRNGKIVAPFPFDKTAEMQDGGDDNVRIQKTAQLGTRDIEIKISSGSGTAEIRK
jgi:DUF4097 and DUF4098 domain-containing protein YvlB